MNCLARGQIFIVGNTLTSDFITLKGFLDSSESQNYRIDQVGRDLDRPLGPTFRGKESLEEIIQHTVITLTRQNQHVI